MIFLLVLKLEISLELWYLERFWFLLEDFLKDYIFTWWNIRISIILLLPLDIRKWQGHSVTHPLFSWVWSTTPGAAGVPVAHHWFEIQDIFVVAEELYQWAINYSSLCIVAIMLKVTKRWPVAKVPSARPKLHIDTYSCNLFFRKPKLWGTDVYY
jgi:hypothetical protein